MNYRVLTAQQRILGHPALGHGGACSHSHRSATGSGLPDPGRDPGLKLASSGQAGPCHLRATSDGQPQYPADNHGHCHPTAELAAPHSSSMNASREYA
jgi:hypothetical protein